MNRTELNNLVIGDMVLIQEFSTSSILVSNVWDIKKDEYLLLKDSNEEYIKLNVKDSCIIQLGDRKNVWCYVDVYNEWEVTQKIIDIEMVKKDFRHIGILSDVTQYLCSLQGISDSVNEIKEQIENFNKIYTNIDNCNLDFMFEIEVYNEISKENDYQLYTINVDRKLNQFWSLSIDSDTNPIMDIDPDFGLDENLEAFYELCVNDILESDDYNLRG